MANARIHPRISIAQVVVFTLLSLLAIAQEKKELSYAVGAKAVIFITNNCGPVTVKPSGKREVLVTIVSRSGAASFVNEQHGDRIELRSMSSRPGTNLVEYTVLVPAAAFVSLRSSDGTLRALGLRGDVVLEAVSGSVEVTDITDARLHVKTLAGAINLTDIRNSHLDVHSVSGDVNLHNVAGPAVEVNSGTGRITYDGDPGRVGEYLLTSHTGDLKVSIPANAWVEIKVRSIKGQPDGDFPKTGNATALGHGNLLVKPGTVSRSRFELRSFSGRIRLSRP
jgi:hypothetical protein